MFLDLRDCRVHYETLGEGLPVVHLHGFYLDLNHLKRPMEQAYAVTPGFRRIYFDLPGMGQTVTHRQLGSAEEMFHVVTEVIDALIGSQPFAIVGGSYGAYLGRMLIRREPNRVTGACFVCPVIFANQSRRTLPLKTLLEEEPHLAERMTPEEYAAFVDVAVIANEHTWRLHCEDICAGLARANAEFLTAYASTGYAFTGEDQGEIETCDKPTLILAGRHDHIVGYQDACLLLPKYSRTTFCVLDRCGHNLPVEQPALFQNLVSDWLRQII